ncbi:MAG: hypothetical protein ACRENP_21950 [Longimicrobiales bacterium]
MSAKLDNAVRQTVQAAIDVAWVQWRALGFVGTGPKPRAMVDPEALILFTLSLMEDEHRFSRLLAWWAHAGSRLLSVQRLKNLMRTFPESVHKGVSEFARTAYTSSDARWRALAARRSALVARPKDLTATPTPDAPGALILRLRLAFSVGIKADVMALLLCMIGARATVSAIARSTGYYSRAVRRAVEDLAAAGFLETSITAPVSYKVNFEAWRSVLGFNPDPPTWRPWAAVFAFVADLKEWWPQVQGQSDYVISSRARDLVTRHNAQLEPQVKLPDPERSPGTAYTEDFIDALNELREWMKGVV